MLHAEEVSKSVMAIYDVVDASKNGELSDLAELLVALDSAKRDIAELHEAIKTNLIEKMGDSPEFTHNGFLFERKNGSPRKTWDHETLGQKVAQRLIDMALDMDTGEMTRSPIEIAVDMLTYAAPSYWRVTELNKIGINADNYCDVGEPKANIIIRKAS